MPLNCGNFEDRVGENTSSFCFDENILVWTVHNIVLKCLTSSTNCRLIA